MGQEIFAHKKREVPDNMKLIANEQNKKDIEKLGGTLDPKAHYAYKPKEEPK
jgi:hypothetical protein